MPKNRRISHSSTASSYLSALPPPPPPPGCTMPAEYFQTRKHKSQMASVTPQMEMVPKSVAVQGNQRLVKSDYRTVQQPLPFVVHARKSYFSHPRHVLPAPPVCGDAAEVPGHKCIVPAPPIGPPPKRTKPESAELGSLPKGSRVPRPPNRPPPKHLLFETFEPTFTFKPGPIGFSLDYSTGIVLTVYPGGQAERLGIKSGMVIKAINGAPFAKETLFSIKDGKQEYKTTFRSRVFWKEPPLPPNKARPAVHGANCRQSNY